jgi:short subunit dehydrogenase-like uncharacterized protein
MEQAMANQMLIYGATGYTGELVARTAVGQGLRPLLGGRNAAGLAPLAGELGLESRVFGLDDAAAVERGLAGVAVVINCAGPFARTSRPLIEACLRTGCHYLDLAGEVPEFEAARAVAAQARVAGGTAAGGTAASGAMVMPGVGFGVVPTDCLAAHLAARLPSATHLTLAFQTAGGVSRGTLLTVLKDVATAGVVRRGGVLLRTMPAAARRLIDFGAGPVQTVLNPWRGDLSSAFHTTGIANIETYSAFPGALQWLMRSSRWIGWLVNSGPVQRLLARLGRGAPAGPSAAERAAGWTRVWGEARDSRSGQQVTARLSGPEAYDFTALTALAVARRALAGEVRPGFQTPAGVYGPDFVLEIPGVKRT